MSKTILLLDLTDYIAHCKTCPVCQQAGQMCDEGKRLARPSVEALVASGLFAAPVDESEHVVVEE